MNLWPDWLGRVVFVITLVPIIWHSLLRINAMDSKTGRADRYGWICLCGGAIGGLLEAMFFVEPIHIWRIMLAVGLCWVWRREMRVYWKVRRTERRQ